MAAGLFGHFGNYWSDRGVIRWSYPMVHPKQDPSIRFHDLTRELVWETSISANFLLVIPQEAIAFAFGVRILEDLRLLDYALLRRGIGGKRNSYILGL